MYPVITISREYGSGGRYIGQKVAEKLNIPFLDREIIKETAQSTGLGESDVEKVSESSSAREKYFHSTFIHGMYIEGEQDRVYRIQKQIILEQAAKGPCVIVGRCADAILENAGIPSFNVFIHAEDAYRYAKAEDEYGLGSIDLAKKVKKIDKERMYYYRYYTDKVWGDYENYHLSLDSGYLGEDLCVDLILAAAGKLNK